MGYQLIVAGTVATAAQMNDALGNNGWTSYTPTVSNFTVGNGVPTGKWMQLGKTVHFRMRFTAGTTTTLNGTPIVTLPVNAVQSGTQNLFQSGWRGASQAAGYVDQLSANQLALYLASANGTYVGPMGPAGVLIFTNGHIFEIAGTYEVA